MPYLKTKCQALPHPKSKIKGMNFKLKPISKDQAEYIRKRCKELQLEVPSISATCREKSKGKRKKK